jgi:hypothetical protein
MPHVRKDVTQGEGKPREETEKEQLWEDGNRWRGFVVR